MDLSLLARRSAELSNDLALLGGRCEHESTRSEITDIAGETQRLSTTLQELRQAIEADNHYTAAFRQDLDEITSELKLLFEEIDECCSEMQKADTPGPVPWFFKKGRVTRLQKHLVALKITLAVMRTVLNHSKDYGVQSSPSRLAESAPHVLYEDRAILDSIFAKNRHAIEDLYDVERAHRCSTSSEAKAVPTHDRNLSIATGVDISPIPDVLPSSVTPTKASRETTESPLQRRFSKRGVRLGVHMFILDMGAHETTEGLRQRWLQAARSAQTSDSSHHKRMTTISEDGTGASLEEAANNSSEDTTSSGHAQATMSAQGSAAGGRRRGNSLKLIGSPVGNAMSKLIKKLSFSDDRSTHEHSTDGEAAGRSFTKKISDRFRQPDITTPEWSEEFENGALGSMKKQF